MSVICRKLGSQDAIVYCKGAPETIVSLSIPESGKFYSKIFFFLFVLMEI